MDSKESKPYILVSACLLGAKVRYDGNSQLVSLALSLSEHFNVIPICPETDAGMPIPRMPSEIRGDRVFAQDGSDVTGYYIKGAEATLETAKRYKAVYAVLKENSPSCGSSYVYDGTFRGRIIPGQGITARLLSENGIEVISEKNIPNLIKAYAKGNGR